MKALIYLLASAMLLVACGGDSKNGALLDGTDSDFWKPATWTIESFGKDPANDPNETWGTDPAWNLCNGVGKLAGCGQDQLGLLWDVIQACAKMDECTNGATACTEPTSPERHAAFAALWDMNAAYPMLVDGGEQMKSCRSQTHGPADSAFPAIPEGETKFEWFVEKYIDTENGWIGKQFCVPGPDGKMITARASVGHGTGTCGQLQLFQNPRNGEVLAQMQGDTRSWSFEASGEYYGMGFCGTGSGDDSGCYGAVQPTADAEGNKCIIPQVSEVFAIQGNSDDTFALPAGWTEGACTE